MQLKLDLQPISSAQVRCACRLGILRCSKFIDGKPLDIQHSTTGIDGQRKTVAFLITIFPQATALIALERFPPYVIKMC